MSAVAIGCAEPMKTFCKNQSDDNEYRGIIFKQFTSLMSAQCIISACENTHLRTFMWVSFPEDTSTKLPFTAQLALNVTADMADPSHGLRAPHVPSPSSPRHSYCNLFPFPPKQRSSWGRQEAPLGLHSLNFPNPLGMMIVAEPQY